MDYKVTMGLEVHIELNTKEKMFCKCKVGFGNEQNTNVCPVCMGLPGTLPKPNKDAIISAIKVGFGTNCKIKNIVIFDRKNYFYKDLPKGYQITQFFNPICKNGYIQLENKKINIKQIHIEEDAAKVDKLGNIDYNRCGVPLLEIVTMPDFETYDEVICFLKKLREILLFLNVSDCKIQEGSMRVDINLSVAKQNCPLGNRIEIKNVGSFKSIKNAIDYETKRYINLLQKKQPIKTQTRRFDEANNKTVFMRYKETIDDYCYFKEPDITNIYLNNNFLTEIKNSLPILPQQKREIYKKIYNLSSEDLDGILCLPKINDLFENLTNLTNQPKEVANLICSELFKILNKQNLRLENINFNTQYISTVINLFLQNKISRDTYKKVFEQIVLNNIEPICYIQNNNLYLLQDKDLIEKTIINILSQNKKTINDYKNGKEKAFKYLTGQCMKAFNGKCDAQTINHFLLKYINT